MTESRLTFADIATCSPPITMRNPNAKYPTVLAKFLLKKTLITDHHHLECGNPFASKW